MRLVEVKLTNFRKYHQETVIKIDPLTVFIGCNDAGKSSLLEALDIFFNDSVIEKEDCSVYTNSTDIKISCVFGKLPNQIIIDEQYPTSLQQEYLVRSDGLFEIEKTYSCTSGKGRLTGVVAKADHPSADGVSDLLNLKITELKTRAKQRSVDLSKCNQSIKAEIRKAIWEQADSLDLSEQDVNLQKEAGKEVWEQLQQYLPVYALFKSDRSSTDQDSEAQEPMKAAIKEAIKKREKDLGNLVKDIKAELERVANRTVLKIEEMSSELAKQLTPQVRNKSWDSLFSVTLTGDNDIPINKRGSGTRRLVLLNFFRAVAEETSESKDTGIIYAIEEPETSQHPNHQLMLLDAFHELVEQSRCQILITTHTPTLARRVRREALRLIASPNGAPTIFYGSQDATLPMIKNTLGILPDHDVKVFFGVEGKHDINFLKRISKILAATEADIPDLEQEELKGRLVFIPLGGSSLELWVSTLARLNRPEFYLTDRDDPPPKQPKYHRQIAEWKARGCTAWATSKRELENYLHIDVLTAEVSSYAGTGDEFDDVPALFAEAVHCSDPSAPSWTVVSDEKKKDKASAAKKRLNTSCVARMTPELLDQSDPQSDIRTWLREIGKALAD